MDDVIQLRIYMYSARFRNCSANRDIERTNKREKKNGEKCNMFDDLVWIFLLLSQHFSLQFLFVCLHFIHKNLLALLFTCYVSAINVCTLFCNAISHTNTYNVIIINIKYASTLYVVFTNENAGVNIRRYSMWNVYIKCKH